MGKSKSSYENIMAGKGGTITVGGQTLTYLPGQTPNGPVKPNISKNMNSAFTTGGTINVGGQYQTYLPGQFLQQANANLANSSGGALSVGGGGSSVGGNVTGGGNIQNIADPFHTQRAQYQTQLSSLMSNPSSFLSSPLAQAMNQNGIEAINRTAAAKHQLKSGNRLADLMKYGQGNAASQYFNQAQLLGGLSGAAPGSPAAAASNTVSLANLASGQNQYQSEQDKIKKATEDANWQNAYTNLYKNMSVF